MCVQLKDDSMQCMVSSSFSAHVFLISASAHLSLPTTHADMWQPKDGPCTNNSNKKKTRKTEGKETQRHRGMTDTWEKKEKENKQSQRPLKNKKKKKKEKMQ